MWTRARRSRCLCCCGGSQPWLAAVLGSVICTSVVSSNHEPPPAPGAGAGQPSAATAAHDESAFPSATAESQGMDPAALAQLAEVVKGYVDSEDALGAELLVIKNRRTVLHEVYGWKDREAGEPMTPDTIFNLRSMTKTLTGAAAQILIDRGDLGLDDPVAKYLPGFDNDASRAITVRELLEHRSGLPLTILKGIDDYENLQAMANAVGERGPEFEIDSKFWYSDSATDSLGAVVEVASGEPLDEFVRKNLLEPLGMSDSLYPRSADDARWGRIASLYVGAANNWLRYWSPQDGKPFYPYAWGSQSLYGTPADYAKFLAMWMDGGRANGKQVLSEQAVARSLTPVSKMSALGSDSPMPTFFSDLEVWYGQMAILYLDEGGTAASTPHVIGHSGSDGTMAWAWPERDLIVLYFTQSRGGLSGLKLEKEIDRLLIHPGLGAETASATPAALEPFLGTYVANFGAFRETEFTVLVQDGKLAVDVPGQMTFELKEPDETGKRYFTLTNAVAVSFDVNEQDEVTGMKMYQAGMTFELPKGKAKQIVDKPLDIDYAKRCAGTYLSEEDQAKIKVFLHDGALAIQPPNVPVPLDLYTPDENGLWTIKLDVSVKIRFDEDESGKIVSFTAILPDGKELVRKRIEEPPPAPDSPDAPATSDGTGDPDARDAPGPGGP